MLRLKSFLNFIVITLLVGGIGYYINGIPEQQMEQGRWVTHTHEVINQLVTLSAELAEASVIHNDFMKNHTADDYDSYNHTVNNIQQTFNTIKNLTRDNPNQQVRIPLLRESIANQINQYTQDIGIRPVAPATSPLNQNKVKSTGIESTGIEQYIEAMRQEEKRLLGERIERWQIAMLHTRLLIMGGVGFFYIIILIAYVVMQKEARLREQLLVIESETAAAQRQMAVRMSQVVEIQQDIIYQRLNLQNAMDIITRRTQQITHADGAVIEMLEGDEMVYRAASGAMKPHIGLKIKAKGSMSGLCIKSNSALRCDDSEIDGRVDKNACRKVGLRSMIVVPLIQQRETVGVLKVTSAQVNAFHLEEMSTLQMMAGVLSATLRDAAATDALQHSNQKLSMSNQLLKTQKTQLESDKIELKTRLDTDGMTGLKNHYYFQECMAQEYSRAKRYNTPLSTIMLDVDYFKKFNDSFGHPAGDELLKQMAAILKNTARPTDCVARYGGEEFAIILVQTPLEGAMRTAERIQENIRKAHWQHGGVTLSMGVSGLENGAKTAAVLIEQADKALYKSKMLGRNKVTAFAA